MNDYSAAIERAATLSPQNDPDTLPVSLSPELRQQQVDAILKSCAADCDEDRERRFRARYPDDTARRAIYSKPAFVRAYDKKTQAYYSGLVQLVQSWAIAIENTETTQTQDVAWLNALDFGITYPVSTISRSLSTHVIATVMKQAQGGKPASKADLRGLRALAHIKRSIRAAHLNKAAGAKPFGSIAQIVGNKLVGKTAAGISKNGNHPAIRIDIDGKRKWLRLDHLLAGIEAIGYAAAPDQLAPAAVSQGSILVGNTTTNISCEIGLKPDPAPDQPARDGEAVINGLEAGQALIIGLSPPDADAADPLKLSAADLAALRDDSATHLAPQPTRKIPCFTFPPRRRRGASASARSLKPIPGTAPSMTAWSIT